MAAKKPTKKTPAKAGGGRVRRAPLLVGSEWGSSTADYEYFLDAAGLREAINHLHQKVHPEDRDKLDRAFAAAIGFSYLQQIDRLAENDEELKYYIRFAKIGYLLAMALVDELLDFQGEVLEGGITSEMRSEIARKAAKAAIANSPKTKAMELIKQEWLEMVDGKKQHLSDAKFAKDMQVKYPVIQNDGSIKNAIGRWRREMK